MFNLRKIVILYCIAFCYCVCQNNCNQCGQVWDNQDALRGYYRDVALCTNGGKLTNQGGGLVQPDGSCLRENAEYYTGVTGYTYVTSYDQYIEILFQQKYEINTLSFHLWDLDKRTYNFYVELILGDQIYQRVYETTAASSWVTVGFLPIKVKGIRFYNRKGTSIPGNPWLHIVKVSAYYAID